MLVIRAPSNIQQSQWTLTPSWVTLRPYWLQLIFKKLCLAVETFSIQNTIMYWSGQTVYCNVPVTSASVL